MDIITRKAQILRVLTPHPYPELNEALQENLNTEVLGVTQSILESALCEELQEHLKQLTGERPRCSGYFTEHGRIDSLSVPKLRHSNGQRDWQILQRYQCGLESLLNFCLCLYVLGLSLRDLQETLYPLLGDVLSARPLQNNHGFLLILRQKVYMGVLFPNRLLIQNLPEQSYGSTGIALISNLKTTRDDVFQVQISEVTAIES
jgi:Transposase, Mutator family